MINLEELEKKIDQDLESEEWNTWCESKKQAAKQSILKNFQYQPMKIIMDTPQTRLECAKIASTFKNETVNDLVEKANNIFNYINKL